MVIADIYIRPHSVLEELFFTDRLKEIIKRRFTQKGSSDSNIDMVVTLYNDPVTLVDFRAEGRDIIIFIRTDIEISPSYWHTFVGYFRDEIAEIAPPRIKFSVVAPLPVNMHIRTGTGKKSSE